MSATDSINNQDPLSSNSEIHCTNCNSTNYILRGCARTDSRGLIQRYQCRDCGQRFRFGPFKGSKYSESDICEILEYCARRWSFCEVAEEFGIAKSEVIHIIEKCTEYLGYYEGTRSPNIGSRLQLDDMYFQLSDRSVPIGELVPSTDADALRVVRELEMAAHGRTFDEIRNLDTKPKTRMIIEQIECTVTNMVDCGSRYYVTAVAGKPHASHSLLSPDDPERLREALTRATKLIGRTQEIRTITTDGLLTAYDPAIRLFPLFEHKFQTKKENPGIVNYCESLNRTVRRHLGVWVRFRTAKSLQTMLEYFRLYYNFIRKHSAIRKTPAEGAGYPSLRGNNTDKLLTAINTGYQQSLKAKRAFTQRLYDRQRNDNLFD